MIIFCESYQKSVSREQMLKEVGSKYKCLRSDKLNLIRVVNKLLQSIENTDQNILSSFSKIIKRVTLKQIETLFIWHQ